MVRCHELLWAQQQAVCHGSLKPRNLRMDCISLFVQTFSWKVRYEEEILSPEVALKMTRTTSDRQHASSPRPPLRPSLVSPVAMSSRLTRRRVCLPLAHCHVFASPVASWSRCVSPRPSYIDVMI